ncbi:MAG: class II fructose-bisphosphate aldolase [Planctomycetota bacterium]
MAFTALGTADLVHRALKTGTVIPGFNIPYLPMMEPVVRALRDTNSFGLVMVARLEWMKFESGSLEAIRDEYERVKDLNHTRLHLDHVPVIDEDDLSVDYKEIVERAVRAGYGSVMVDGSRLPLDGNIDCTKAVVEIAHAAGIPVEAELGAIMGHEAGPLPPYDELFESGRGFTDPAQTKRFVEETNVDWLSIAIGNIHGAISAARKSERKIEARLDINRLDDIREAAGIPLVLHGGTGISKDYIIKSIQHGIAKVNVATAIRQPYEKAVQESLAAGQEAVYRAMLAIIREDLEIGNSAARLA